MTPDHLARDGGVKVRRILTRRDFYLWGMPKDIKRCKNPGNEQDLRESLPPENPHSINLSVTVKT